MNPLIYTFLIVLFSTGCSSNEQNNSNRNVAEEALYNNDLKTLDLEFPVEPEIHSEVLPIKGHKVNFTTYLASSDSGVYLLYELEIGALRNQVIQDESGFFNGIISYLMNDIGAQVGTLSHFNYEGFTGYNFNNISPNKSEKRTAKGKALLVNERAYIWIGISNASDSAQKVNQFINSFILK